MMSAMPLPKSSFEARPVTLRSERRERLEGRAGHLRMTAYPNRRYCLI
jgi:hypothetical protein